MKNLRAEYSVSLSSEKVRSFVFLLALAAGSLLLAQAIHALSRSAAATAATAGQTSEGSYSPTAGQLVDSVIANELTDREQLRKWICMIEKRAGNQLLTQVQVETNDGPLYRLLQIDGATLSATQRQQDDARIGRLLKDPRPLQKLKQAQAEDEVKLQKLMSLMPQAFVYEYDGVEGNLLRVKFRPNPDYVPSTYEARVIHSLAGTILIDARRKRLAKVAGQLINRVEFGYGLLGRIDSGTLELQRTEVAPQLWKTAFINIHFSGRVAIFKTVTKDQYERRSEFSVVSSDLTLSDGKELLNSRVASPSAILSSKK